MLCHVGSDCILKPRYHGCERRPAACINCLIASGDSTGFALSDLRAGHCAPVHQAVIAALNTGMFLVARDQEESVGESILIGGSGRHTWEHPAVPKSNPCTHSHPLPIRVQVLDSNSTSLSADTAVSVPELVQMLRCREAVVVYRRSVAQRAAGLDLGVSGLYGYHAAFALRR